MNAGFGSLCATYAPWPHKALSFPVSGVPFGIEAIALEPSPS